MKKTKKSRLLIILGITLILLAIAIINVIPILFMKPVETGKILETGVYAVKNNINSLFLIEADEGYVVIDAGSDADAVESGLKEMKINPLDVKYVLLTHTDADHVAALTLFSNAEIFMSEDELQMVDGSTKRNIFSKNTLPAGTDLNSIKLLADGETINLGGLNIESMKSPGHTLGSMTYLINEEYLFTGDILRVNNNIMELHPFTMNRQSALETIREIEKVKKGARFIFTAHYGYFEANKLSIKMRNNP